MQNLLNTIWNHGISIAERAQNPVLYPFFLGAIALSLLLGIINFALDIRSKTLGEVLTAELLWLVVFEWLPIYGIWLAFATPPTALPFAAPAPGSSWLFLPAPPTYTIIAVLLHGLLSAFALLVTVVWLAQMRTPNNSRIDTLCILLALLGIILGWELQHWPLTFIVVTELLVVMPLASQYLAVLIWGVRDTQEAPYGRRILATQMLGTGVAIALILLWHNSTLVQWYLLAAIVAGFLLSLYYGSKFAKATPKEKSQLVAIYLFVSTLVTIILWIAGMVAQSRWHIIDPVIFNIAAVFYLFIQFDVIFVVAFGNRFKRMIFLPLIALIVALVAASGAFVAITHNPGFNYSIWLEGGIAAATFLLFSPLTQLASEAFRVEQVAKEREGRERISDGLLEILRPLQALQAPLEGQRSHTVQQAEQSAPNTNILPDQKLQQILPQQAPRLAGIQKEYEMLQFQGGIFFLLLGIGYHWVALNPDILAALNGNLLGLVFAGIAAFTGMLAISVDRDNDTSRAVLLLLLLLTGSLAGVDILLNTALSGELLNIVVPGGAFNLFTNHQVALFTIRSVVEETLVLLAGGQFFYLIVIVIAYLGRQATIVANDLEQRLN